MTEKDSWGYCQKPFNPEFKENAKTNWDLAVKKATEQEELEKNKWTREKRALTRKEIYEKLMGK